jgi:hypothetical protein
MAIFPQGFTHIDKRCANAVERNTLAPAHFSSCLRIVFSSCRRAALTAG